MKKMGKLHSINRDGFVCFIHIQDKIKYSMNKCLFSTRIFQEDTQFVLTDKFIVIRVMMLLHCV